MHVRSARRSTEGWKLRSRGKMDSAPMRGGPEADSTPASTQIRANRLAEASCRLRRDVLDKLAGDGAIIAEIYKERVTKRGYGSGMWGWKRPIAIRDRLMQLSSALLVRRRSRNLETEGRSAMARSHSTRKACIPKAAAHKASFSRPCAPHSRCCSSLRIPRRAASFKPRPKPCRKTSS